MAESTLDELERKRAQNRKDVAAWQARNPDKVRAIRANWYQMNKEKRRVQQNAYRKEISAQRSMDQLTALEGALKL